MGPRRVLDTKTYWLTDRQSQYDFDFDFELKEYKDYNGVVNWELSVALWSVNQRATEAEQFPLLRSSTRKRLMKTLQKNSQCVELLPGKDYWK
jgi:hypothetical protein